MDDERKKNVYRAKLAEQAERYDEMVTFMQEVCTKHAGSTSLTQEERNLLSVAYKNVVGARRASYRIVFSIEEKEKLKDSSSPSVNLIAAYRAKIEDELDEICGQILEILDKHLIASCPPEDSEAQVFYRKMKGDYYRYLAEFKKTDNTVAEQSQTAYQEASEIANKSLASTHPIRLGLALNFSVFMYEVMTQQVKACDLAKHAFDDAIAELDSLDEESYKDSTLIMQLLRDNLTLWTSEKKDGENLAS